ncbi:MAG TPA: hypothetical protein VKT77_16815 [Chthonomonadaceae bacterium]|nr:hypothetical protein [Chthonomonadaceae bacterium]
MLMKRTAFLAAAVAAAGLVFAGGAIVAGAQSGDAKGGAAVPQAAKPDAARPDNGAKPDAATQERLRAELNDLLRQRATLERKIDETRRKLGEGASPDRSVGQGGATHHRFEFQNGNGAPQVFEFDGDGTGNMPPEARKQFEEAQKRMRDAFGSMQFDNFPDFQFGFGADGQGGFDMRPLRDMMQRMQQNMRDRSLRGPNGNRGAEPNAKPQDKSNKPATGKLKTYDA